MSELPILILKDITGIMGAQWLSGRVLDSRVQASPASLHCVLEQDTFIQA